jgi:ABC-type nitrate/sulfonate/bicarbonate transport system substrate-binding protein
VGIKNISNESMIAFLLASQGLDFEDIIPIRVGFELHPLIDDEIDVFSGYLTNEPLLMKALGYEVNVIPAYQYGFDLYAGVYFVQEAMLQEQPAVLEKFLNVTFRGWREAFRDPAAAAQLIVDHYYPEGGVQQQAEELKLYRFLATRGVGEKLLGIMRDTVWTKGIEILYQSGQIEHKIPANELFSPEFVERIYSEQ